MKLKLWAMSIFKIVLPSSILGIAFSYIELIFERSGTILLMPLLAILAYFSIKINIRGIILTLREDFSKKGYRFNGEPLFEVLGIAVSLSMYFLFTVL